MRRRKKKKIIKSFFIILILFLIGCFILFPKDKLSNNTANVKEIFNTEKKKEEDKQKKYEECMSKPYKMDTLDEEFNNLFKSHKNDDVSIYFTEINNDYSYKYNENEAYYSGCVVKLYSIVYLVEQAREGKLDINQKLTYLPQDKIAYSDMTDQHKFYEEIPMLELIRYILTISDNSAYYIIKRNYSISSIKTYFKDKYDIKLHMTDRHPFESNYTTEESNKLLKMVYELFKTDDEITEVMKSAMSNEVENTLNFDDVKFLHKYGEYNVWHNDTGIYDSDNPYLVSIFTTRAKTDYKTFIPKVSKELYTIYKKNLDSKEEYCKNI